MDRLEDLWYWILDNKQIVGGIVILLAVVGFFIYGKTGDFESNRLTPGYEPGTMEEVNAMKERSEDLDEVFSELEVRNVTVNEKYPAYDVSLYLKRPFISKRDLELQLTDFIDMYKWKTNDTMSGIKIDIYDRKEVFDKELLPRATVYYSKKFEAEDLLGEDEGGTRERGEDTNMMNFQDTIAAGKKPKYEDYDMIVRGFKPMTYSEEIIPLTDQEFSFYLKLDIYSTLAGGSKYGGVRTYLEWDLGKDLYKDGIVAIEREFDDFRKRHVGLGGQENYYDNEMILKQKLVVTDPQFLLYATQKKIEDDPLEAQNILLKSEPDLYKKPLQEYVEERSDDISDEFNSDNNEELNEDEEDDFEDTEEEVEEDEDNNDGETEFEFEEDNEDSNEE